MIKYLRHYLTYAFFFILVGVTIDVAWLFMDANHRITLWNLWANIEPSLVIGTISAICVTIVARRMRTKPLAGYLTNFLVIAVLIVILFFLQNFSVPYSQMLPMWLVIFLVVEAMSSIMVAIAYKLNFLYNDKLEQKKASLEIK